MHANIRISSNERMLSNLFTICPPGTFQTSREKRKWITETDIAYWYTIKSDDEDETCFERRKPGLPIGLKNLGNTCYVNSFLQIWFHNTQFRKALYSWDPEQDEEEKDNQVCAITQFFICLPF